MPCGNAGKQGRVRLGRLAWMLHGSRAGAEYDISDDDPEKRCRNVHPVPEDPKYYFQRITFHESDSQVRPSGPSDQTKKVPEKKQLNESDGTYEQIAVKLRRILSKTDICSETDVCYFSVSRK